jgi:hypothetical protein
MVELTPEQFNKNMREQRAEVVTKVNAGDLVKASQKKDAGKTPWHLLAWDVIASVDWTQEDFGDIGLDEARADIMFFWNNPGSPLQQLHGAFYWLLNSIEITNVQSRLEQTGDCIPWYGLEQVAKVLEFGARKYAPRGWEHGIEHSRTWSATMRHLFQRFELAEINDAETGLDHLAHAACELMFLLAYELRGKKTCDATGAAIDDRPVYNATE